MDPEEYIRDARRGGISDAGIEKILVNMGHDPAEVKNWLTHGASSAMWHPPSGAAAGADNKTATAVLPARRRTALILAVIVVLILGGAIVFVVSQI